MSWDRAGSNLVTWFTGREQLSELWQNHMHAIKCIATCKPSLSQLNLDVEAHACGAGWVRRRRLPVDELLRSSDNSLVGLKPDRALGSRGASG